MTELSEATACRGESEMRGGRPVSREQQKVVDTVLNQNVTVVGAGAGSGKTYTSIAAVIELLMQGMKDPERQVSIDQFVLITFTNKAADSLRQKIREALEQQYNGARKEGDPDRAHRWRTQMERLSAAYIGTIHSFCWSVLRTYGYEQQIPRTSDITFAGYVRKQAIKTALNDKLDDEQIQSLYSSTGAMEDYELIKLVESVLDEVYNRGLDVHEVVEWTRDQPNDDKKRHRVAFARLVELGHEQYIQKKREQNVLDSYQLLVETARLLDSDHGDHVVDRLTSRYRYLFVDEFQDTDKTQVEIINRLNSGNEHGLRKVLVVGDEKQSIYGWRGSPEALVQTFADDHEVDVLPMNVSRRPTQSYLRAQNALIESMGMNTLHPYEGTWDPDVDLRSSFVYINAGTDRTAGGQVARIERTAEVIRGLLQRRVHIRGQDPGPVEPGHVVILGRSNRILEEYAEGLRMHFAQEDWGQVDFRLDRGEAFYQRPEVVSVYHMLRVLERGDKDAVLSAAIDTHFMHEVDATEKELDIVQFGRQREGSLARWLARNHPSYIQAFQSLRSRMQVDTVPQLLERMYRVFGIRNHYRSLGRQERIEGLDRLHEVARHLYDEDQALTLRDFIDYLQTSILTGQDEQESPASEEEGYPSHVRLMTVHRAKGLEFPIVVIPEVQKPMSRDWEDPSFLVLEPNEDANGGASQPGGIEVQLNDLNATSSRYDDAVRRHRQETEDEEKRILYVAITRAEHAAILVGSGRMPDDGPRHRNSWRDEVLHAQEDLEAEGARFVN
jgi:DNA helicase-2/ATP-dependent DNA helicase PcrA